MFPPEAPLAADLDSAALAGAVRLAGGNIRNVALAAFAAAAAARPIGIGDLWLAAAREHRLSAGAGDPGNARRASGRGA